MRVLMLEQKEQRVRAEYAARAGLEDTIYELFQGNKLVSSDTNISSDWQFGSSGLVYKTNNQTSALSFFEYPVTYSVTVEGDINVEVSTVNVLGEVSSYTNLHDIYRKSITALISKTFDGSVIIHSLIDNEDG